MVTIAQIVPEQNHVAIRVRDPEATAEFYRSVVGLPILWTAGDTARPRSIFLSGIQLNRAEEQEISELGVFDHIGISVANIEEIVASLVAHGITLERPLGEPRPLNGRLIRATFFRDNDGNRVELVEWTDPP